MSSLAVASQARNSLTPVKQTPPAAQDSPGRWRHPKLVEITERRSRTVFGEKHIRAIVYNVSAIAILELLRTFVVPYLPGQIISTGLQQYTGWAYMGLVLIPLFNIGQALLPLMRPADNFSDIPLTPGQRKLLGLPPTTGGGKEGATTPGSAYSTPPRYKRTPSHGSPAVSIQSNQATNNSPLSGRGSPLSGQPMSGNSPYSPYSPYSPSTYSPSPVKSPLLQKAVQGRRNSFGSGASANLGSSVFGASTSSSNWGGDGPSTPSPGSGKRSSVALNNKWLYEKGRRSSGNNW